MNSLIYLIRHGEIDKPSPRRFLGQTDLPLNNKGIRRAQALCQQFKDIPFTQVFTSPLTRAVQTAALVSGRPIKSLQQIEAFKEINLGDWEGLSIAEVQERFPGAYEQRGQNLEHFRPQGGESFGDLAHRCYPALLNLAKTWPGPLLVVAHAGVNRVLLSCLQRRPLQHLLEIRQDYCEVTLLRYHSQELHVETINLDGIC